NSTGNSNVICSGSDDNTIRFWDIRSNKNELFMIKGDEKEDNGILCLKFISLKNKVNDNEQKLKNGCGVHLYYGSYGEKKRFMLFLFAFNKIFEK
ncbi:hypothetical protein RFI_37401, partial [Reticulomyxa filosa]